MIIMTLLEFVEERFGYREQETNFAENNTYGIIKVNRLKDLLIENQYNEILENFKKYHYLVVPLNPRICTNMICEEDGNMVFYEFGKNRHIYFSYEFDLYSPIFKLASYVKKVFIRNISFNGNRIDFDIIFYNTYEEISLYTDQDYLHKLFKELNNLKDGNSMTFEEYEFIREKEWIKYSKTNLKGGNEEWE